ncbi:hypothetical protein WCLP8_980002 [uncultured Gammaproteobacteria bacterium]
MVERRGKKGSAVTARPVSRRARTEPVVAKTAAALAADLEGWAVTALSGRLTVNEAESRRAELADLLLAQGQKLALETAEVEAVDGAGLQLLIALRLSAERRGVALRLAAAPEGALLAALVAAGFGQVDRDTDEVLFRDRFWSGQG